MKKKYPVLLGAVILISILLSLVVIWQKSEYDKRMYITKVGNEGILRSDYEKELARTKHFFVWARQDISKLPSLDHDVLERMIEMKLVSQYARKNKITVSQKEIEDGYRAGLGKKSEAEYLATIREMYGMEKGDYLQKLSEDLLKEKVQMELKMPLSSWLTEMKKQLK